MGLQIWLPNLQRSQKQAKAGNYKTESHQRQTRSDPGEKRSFCRKVIARGACHTIYNAVTDLAMSSKTASVHATVIRCYSIF
jgi:hypothetical protein